MKQIVHKTVELKNAVITTKSNMRQIIEDTSIPRENVKGEIHEIFNKFKIEYGNTGNNLHSQQNELLSSLEKKLGALSSAEQQQLQLVPSDLTIGLEKQLRCDELTLSSSIEYNPWGLANVEEIAIANRMLWKIKQGHEGSISDLYSSSVEPDPAIDGCFHGTIKELIDFTKDFGPAYKGPLDSTDIFAVAQLKKIHEEKPELLASAIRESEQKVSQAKDLPVAEPENLVELPGTLDIVQTVKVPAREWHQAILEIEFDQVWEACGSCWDLFVKNFFTEYNDLISTNLFGIPNKYGISYFTLAHPILISLIGTSLYPEMIMDGYSLSLQLFNSDFQTKLVELVPSSVNLYTCSLPDNGLYAVIDSLSQVTNRVYYLGDIGQRVNNPENGPALNCLLGTISRILSNDQSQFIDNNHSPASLKTLRYCVSGLWLKSND